MFYNDRQMIILIISGSSFIVHSRKILIFLVLDLRHRTFMSALQSEVVEGISIKCILVVIANYM